jgi:hypothetical protein
VLSSLPAWRFIDPLPIIGTTGNADEGDEESLESIIEQGSEKVKLQSENAAVDAPLDEGKQNSKMDNER